MIKIGLHILPGPHTPDLLSMIGRLAHAGRPVPICTVVDDPDLANQIKLLSPKTIVVYRLDRRDNPTPTTSGKAWFDSRVGDMLKAGQADYWQFANEWWAGIPPTAYAQFYIDLMSECTKIGRHCTVGDWNAGAIEDSDLPALKSMLEQAAAQRHIIDYHAYDSTKLPQGDQDMSFDSQWFDMRWVHWLVAYPSLRILFGECGNNDAKFLGVDQTLKLMQQFNDMLQPYPQALAGSWWTFGGQGAWGWDQSSDDSILPKYEAWLMTMAGTPPTIFQPAPATLGLTEFIADTAKDDASEEWLLRKVSGGDNPREYVLNLGTIQAGTVKTPPAPQPPPVTVKIFTVITDSDTDLRVRELPSLNAKVVGAVASGVKVTAANEPASAWVHIVAPIAGYVSREWVK